MRELELMPSRKLHGNFCPVVQKNVHIQHQMRDGSVCHCTNEAECIKERGGCTNKYSYNDLNKGV